MTATLTEAKTYTEWGVRRTWPDGHVEVSRVDDRFGAEAQVRISGNRRDFGHLAETAEVVSRHITVSDWQVPS